MLRHSIAVIVALLVLAGSLLAADKEVKGKGRQGRPQEECHHSNDRKRQEGL